MLSRPPSPSHALPLLVALGAVALGALLWACAALPWPDAATLLTHQGELQAAHTARPWAFAAVLFTAFTLLSALALPGCSVLALAAGLCMGWLPGTVLVALASAVGATVSFLVSRHLWRDRVRRRWGHRLGPLEAGLARDGAYYLFALRVAPVIPYGVVNPLMGLSAMPTGQFFGVSLVGMLAGSAAYVYAGTALGRAHGWRDLLTPGIALALCVLAALPWLARTVWRRWRDLP